MIWLSSSPSIRRSWSARRLIASSISVNVPPSWPRSISIRERLIAFSPDKSIIFSMTSAETRIISLFCSIRSVVSHSPNIDGGSVPSPWINSIVYSGVKMSVAENFWGSCAATSTNSIFSRLCFKPSKLAYWRLKIASLSHASAVLSRLS